MLTHVGNATSSALNYYLRYLEEHKELPRDLVQNPEEFMSGNGSLMRLCAAPLFALELPPADAARLAIATSVPTHASPLCTGACALFALYIYHLVRSPLPSPVERKRAVLDPKFALRGDGPRLSELQNPLIRGIRLGNGWRGLPSSKIRTTGFVVHTLQAALWALDTTDTFEAGMLALLPLGDDVDTVCAVYGQIAGACYGLEGIPARWKEGLARRELIDGFAERMANMVFS
jgi:ADP-ribosyl-[dinitrogen reductase] hydrolase